MSRALLRHRRLLSPGARGGAAHPFVAAISASSCYTARFASTSATAAAAAGTQADPAAAASPAAAGEQPRQPPPPAARGRWGLLKFGALAAVAGAIGGVGYATYGAIPRSLLAISPPVAVLSLVQIRFGVWPCASDSCCLSLFACV